MLCDVMYCNVVCLAALLVANSRGMDWNRKLLLGKLVVPLISCRVLSRSTWCCSEVVLSLQVESLELLKKRKCPFIIALNKIDILYKWNAKSYTSVQEALSRQEQSVRQEFQTRFNNVVLQLNERGLNCNLQLGKMITLMIAPPPLLQLSPSLLQ